MIKISNTKEHSLKELTSLSFQFFKQNIKTVSISIITLMILPTLIFQLSFNQKSSTLFQFIGFILSSITSIVFYLIIFDLQKQENKSLKKLLISKNTLIKFKRLILTGILQVILIFGLTFLFIIPGIIFAIYWAFSTFVVIDKDLSGKKALNYSKLLIKKHWWKIFLISLINYCPLLFTLITKIPSNNPLMVILNSIIMSFTAVVIMITYFNLDQVHINKEIK